MDSWPLDHTIGVYLSVDGVLRPVGTAKDTMDVPFLLRKLAEQWEAYGTVPADEVYGQDVLFVDIR